MDDLAGLDWSAKPAQTTKAAHTPPVASFSSLRPTPSPFASGRNTPLSAQSSGLSNSKPSAAPTKPAQDSFSGLVNFGSAKSSTANLSLKEQQERLEAEKRKKEEERKKNLESQFGQGQFLDSLGSRGSSRTQSPALAPPRVAPKAPAQNGSKGGDDDLFAAFRADTKVDNASFYPPPPSQPKTSTPSPAPAANLDLKKPSAWNQGSNIANSAFGDDDDDPFGLNQLKPKAPVPQQSADTGDEEDDDLLGDLGRPVEEVRKKQQQQQAASKKPEPEPGKPIELSESDSEDDPAPATSNDPFDRAVAQLVDYGFTPENARRGLTESGAGLNVQAAVNWLLDDAHRHAKEKAQGKSRSGEPRRESPSDSAAWMKEAGRADSQRRDNRSPALVDGDIAKTAAAVGTSFLKTANSLWKTGQKKVQKAMQDFQQEEDPSQPKWMRQAQQDRLHGSELRPDAADEAMILDPGMRRGRKASQQPPESRPSPQPSLSRGTSRGSVPKWQQQQPAAPIDARSRLNRLAAEEDMSTYVSPNRRKKTTPEPRSQPPPAAEPDLLLDALASSAPKTAQRLPQRPNQQTPPVAHAKRPGAPSPRPSPTPSRQVPPIAPAALQTSTRHRLEGTTHFKRGDYASAHESYSSSLAAVPPTHPLAIVLLTNRALTCLKTGEPKKAIEDSDMAIKLIGPGCGKDETVAVVGENGSEEKRGMKDLYGKALSRKAEALEQMERWADAGGVWQLCVESNVGGATALAGKQRCQKALAPKAPAKPAAAPRKPTARPARSAMADLGPQKSSEAVERLRKANEEAAREDDEKFAISERVDARIATWRDGKRDNLRALLGSLDTVLWEGSGWKKVGMHELVVANKVKIIYMKAIAKTHPDKVCWPPFLLRVISS